MEKVPIDKWLTLFANGAVLVGIIFLALEIQQTNRIAKAESEHRIRDQFRELNVVILENPAVAQLLVKAWNADAEFSDVETEQAYAFLYAFLNTWASTEEAYNNGIIPEWVMEMAIGDIQGVATDYPGLKPLMKVMVEELPQAFGESRVIDMIRESAASP